MTMIKDPPESLRGRVVPAFSVEPESLVIITDPKHPFYDERIHLPIQEEMVVNIMVMGVIKTIIVVRDGDRLLVWDGRQRTRCAIEANRRLRAQGEASIKVLVMFRGGTEKDMGLASDSANEFAQRDDVMVKAAKCRRRINLGATLKDCAIAWGVSVDTIENWLKLEDLHHDVREKVRKGDVSYTAAMRLSKLPRERQVQALRKLMKAGATNANAVRAVVGGRLEKVTPPSKNALRRIADGMIKNKSFLRGESESDAFSFTEWVLGRVSTDELLDCLHSGVLANVVKEVIGKKKR